MNVTPSCFIFAHMRKHRFRIKDIKFFFSRKPIQEANNTILVWCCDNITKGDINWLEVTKNGGSQMTQHLLHLKNSDSLKGEVPVGMALICPGTGLLKADYVIHAEMPSRKNSPYADSIMYNLWMNIFLTIEKFDSYFINTLHIVFPPSVIYGPNTEKKLLEITCQSLINFSIQEYGTPLKNIVIHCSEEEQKQITKEFEKILFPSFYSKVINKINKFLKIKNVTIG